MDLDTPTSYLEAKLDRVPANPVAVVLGYADIGYTSNVPKGFTGKPKITLLTGDTATQILDGPPIGKIRETVHLFLLAEEKFRISFFMNVDGTQYPLPTFLLASGDNLTYTEEKTWVTTDACAAIRQQVKTCEYTIPEPPPPPPPPPPGPPPPPRPPEFLAYCAGPDTLRLPMCFEVTITGVVPAWMSDCYINGSHIYAHAWPTQVVQRNQDGSIIYDSHAGILSPLVRAAEPEVIPWGPTPISSTDLYQVCKYYGPVAAGTNADANYCTLSVSPSNQYFDPSIFNYVTTLEFYLYLTIAFRNGRPAAIYRQKGSDFDPTVVNTFDLLYADSVAATNWPATCTVQAVGCPSDMWPHIAGFGGIAQSARGNIPDGCNPCNDPAPSYSCPTAGTNCGDAVVLPIGLGFGTQVYTINNPENLVPFACDASRQGLRCQYTSTGTGDWFKVTVPAGVAWHFRLRSPSNYNLTAVDVDVRGYCTCSGSTEGALASVEFSTTALSYEYPLTVRQGHSFTHQTCLGPFDDEWTVFLKVTLPVGEIYDIWASIGEMRSWIPAGGPGPVPAANDFSTITGVVPSGSPYLYYTPPVAPFTAGRVYFKISPGGAAFHVKFAPSSPLMTMALYATADTSTLITTLSASGGLNIHYDASSGYADVWIVVTGPEAISGSPGPAGGTPFNFKWGLGAWSYP